MHFKSILKYNLSFEKDTATQKGNCNMRKETNLCYYDVTKKEMTWTAVK